MARYIVNRLFQLVPTLVLVSLVVFVAMQLAPGDPAIEKLLSELESMPRRTEPEGE